ncbi:MAG: AMP-binding protein [Nitrospirota bacterium]
MTTAEARMHVPKATAAAKLPKSLWTLPAIVQMQAEKYGVRTFCTFQDGASLTFEQLETESNSLASALAEIGVQAGDRVLALLHNGREFVLTLIATHKRGAIFVPINTELKGAFLQHQLKNTEPRVVIVDAELRKAFDTVEMSGIPISSTVMVGGATAPLPGTKAYSFDALAGTEPQTVDVETATPYDACTIMFTSGTTGPAKGVLMPHALCYYYAFSAMRSTALNESDRMYISMPMFHGTACWLQLYSSLLAGATVHVVKRFSAQSWLTDIRASGATVTYAVGVMPEFILKQPRRDDDHENPLRLSWSVPVSDSWGREFEQRFGLRILQGYGMTEFSVPVWGDLGDPVQAGCAGRVLEDFFEVHIVDPETDERMSPNQIGEIVVRPKEPGVFMAGYFRMPEKTVEAWRNLWFHSGDAGYFDDQGRLFYVDRIRDRIRRRGENISSFEVEEVVSSHPDVMQCAVVGVKVDGAGGEDEVMAYVVLSSSALDPKELLDWCAPRMPRYALPRFIEFVTDIERTASGKIRKQAIRDAGVTSKTWDRESIGYVVPR